MFIKGLKLVIFFKTNLLTRLQEKNIRLNNKIIELVLVQFDITSCN